MFSQKAVNRGLKLDLFFRRGPPAAVCRTTRSLGGMRNEDLKARFLVDPPEASRPRRRPSVFPPPSCSDQVGKLAPGHYVTHD